jgi:hypothetical protein
MNKHVEFLVKLRDCSLQLADAAQEYIQSLAPPELELELTGVLEVNFASLRFKTQQSPKLGNYEVTRKTDNSVDKWSHAYNILQAHNSTIDNRYHGSDYQYSYWLFGEDKIYRQKLKP